MHLLTRPGRLLAALLVATTLHAVPAHAKTCEGDKTARDLLDATDDVTRGQSSIATMEMHVKTSHYERTMKMKAWSKGTDDTLIRILEPAKDAGMATLKVGDNIWNYLPKVDRTMKVPAGMMSGNWMGSHFTNDDLVKESRLADDYTYEFTECPADNEDGLYVLTLTPKPDAPVVWGKVVSRVRPDEQPVEVTYYDEHGNLVRTMTFEDYKTFGDRTAPTKMTLVPADKPGEFTQITYDDLQFAADIPSSTFTLQALEQ